MKHFGKKRQHFKLPEDFSSEENLKSRNCGNFEVVPKYIHQRLPITIWSNDTSYKRYDHLNILPLNSVTRCISKMNSKIKSINQKISGCASIAWYPQMPSWSFKTPSVETRITLQRWIAPDIRSSQDLKATENFKSERIISTITVLWNLCCLENEAKSPPTTPYILIFINILIILIYIIY